MQINSKETNLLRFIGENAARRLYITLKEDNECIRDSIRWTMELWDRSESREVVGASIREGLEAIRTGGFEGVFFERGSSHPVWLARLAAFEEFCVLCREGSRE